MVSLNRCCQHELSRYVTFDSSVIRSNIPKMEEGQLDEEALLIGLAQTGCALAGFAGLFVTLRTGTGRIAADDWLMLRIVLETSCATIVLAFFPCVVWYFKFHGRKVWQASSLAFAVLTSFYLGWTIQRALEFKVLAAGALPLDGWFLLRIAPLLPAIFVAAWNGVSQKGRWPKTYLFCLFMLPLVAVANFFSLIGSFGIAAAPSVPNTRAAHKLSRVPI